MRLILFNYESNAFSRFSFAQDWINEIAQNVEKLYVISLRCGNYEVATNVEVYCIQQNKKNRLQTIYEVWKILNLIHSKDKNISGYFVHMAHYFVPIILPFAKLYNQKIVLWYAHKSVPFSLRIAEKLCDTIVSTSKQSMRIDTYKLKTIGHGIDVNQKFVLKNIFSNKIINILSAGRISKIKNIDIIIDAFVSLERNDVYLYIAGEAITTADKEYLEKLQNSIPPSMKLNIIFLGLLSLEELSALYHKMDLVINLSDTGSLDKAIIEPMAMGIPVITSNDSSHELFSHLNGQGIYLIKHPNDLLKTLSFVLDNEADFDRIQLRNEVIQNHSLSNLAKKIVGEFA